MKRLFGFVVVAGENQADTKRNEFVHGCLSQKIRYTQWFVAVAL
jgi:hypothetical protein